MTQRFDMFAVIDNGILKIYDRGVSQKQRDYLRDLTRDKEEAYQGGSIVIGVTSEDRLNLLTKAARPDNDTEVILNLCSLGYTPTSTTLGTNIIYEVEPTLGEDVYNFVERYQNNTTARTDIVLLK